MIKNGKQFQVTSEKLQEFRNALKIIEVKEDVNPILKEIQIKAITAQIEILEDDIREYSLLKAKKITNAIANSLNDLPQLLIKGRIVKGWSHSDLAERLNLKAQQIQRYEASNYETASLARIIAIASELGIYFNPIKANFEDVNFNIPEGISLDQIKEAQIKLNDQKTLLAIKI